jgi:asparagine synthase (glutamine-hydrolysing)
MKLQYALASMLSMVAVTDAFQFGVRKSHRAAIQSRHSTGLGRVLLDTPTASSSSSSTTTRRDMCGLVAIIANEDANNNEAELPDITANTKCITHRGPDGMLILDNPLTNSSFKMGHTRLAIVDPTAAGNQPFSLELEGRKYHLAANGEIYNHLAVYGDLVANEGWTAPRISHSDCEVIAHAYAQYGVECASKLDGMFAFVVLEEDDDGTVKSAYAARDPVGIKPLYYGSGKNGEMVFASELKALVGLIDPATVVAMPPGHYWTRETGLVCYYNPDWLRKDDYAPWNDEDHVPATDEEIRLAFRKAVQKRMMADVTYGFFLSGGIDSAVVAHDLLPLYVEEQLERVGGDMTKFQPIKTYTVGMEDSPDVMAAKAVVEALGGSKYIDHQIRTFTPDEVFDLIPQIVYHMETYEAELIRSAIPNWLLAEIASRDVKMVLTGEGSDEIFAGYLYFQDAASPQELQTELRRIYNMLGNINLHRTDRMTMAHGLEARVPFLDTEFTKLVMSVDPKRKMVDPDAVKNNRRGREKTLLRELFEEPNAMGDSIPGPVLWRAKAMQCEGVGEDWVSILQNKIGGLVTDEEMALAATKYPLNTPHTKEEYYYRTIFDNHYGGMEHVVKLWEGGGRAMGAAWKSDLYTREGLKNVDLLSHSLQKKSTATLTNETVVVA